MRLASLLSGGKDSMYALYLAKKAGHEIKYIVYFESENEESYMFHTPNIQLVEEQAKLLGIEVIKKKTKGVKEEELKDIKVALKDLDIDGITTGAIASNYQKSRIDNICNELKIESIAPFWGHDPETTLRSMLKDGFKIMIVAVAAPPLDESWLGRIIDDKTIDELVILNKKYGIHIMFEGGEAESFVLSCPLFKKEIIPIETIIKWDEKTRSGVLKINSIRLKDKV